MHCIILGNFSKKKILLILHIINIYNAVHYIQNINDQDKVTSIKFAWELIHQ